MNMTQEEKAKRYDEAKARIIEAYNSNRCTISFMDEIFPELKESEDDDEVVRKELIDAIHGLWDNDALPMPLSAKRKDSWLAWLEKQVNKEPKKVPIWKHWKDGIAGNGDGEQIYLIKVGNLYYITSCLSFECDYIELSELDNLMYEKQDEQKWNKEDESKIEDITYFLNTAKAHYASTEAIDDCVAWLQSLRVQKQWKPSEKQIKALHDLNIAGNISHIGQAQLLIELYNDLKKLIE